MNYSTKWIKVSRDELLKDLAEKIKPSRYQHVLRVEQTAIELAKANQVDIEKASIAALMHDYAKDYPLDEMKALAQQYWNYPLLNEAGGNIWHGFAAATIAKQDYGITDKDILDAIAVHTIGWHAMTPLMSVIFIADYIEPGRNFPGVETVRQITQQSLDQAVGYKLTHNIQYLLQQQQPLFLPTIEFYNQWIKNNMV
ncbi:bis(5'-nucleosyl)-tetraphosphatase (symmetrical) YqeK [Aerococcaceae bacterium zg-ZJ1578]|uniref:bis(5'-nucleosyl)-tetraphosphatase (symmetrical) YqeK n=1 Tax=Aerococcaceae bacterium zg-252 TaxID=2796928 RepID=UPI001A20EF1B|nr:bis(5'-nucleosyl)-tetraphosphatase (symmetrical) YqeK [Aerococcaceae bacterium zg-1578]